MFGFHGPQAARVADLVHDKFHAAVQGLRDMREGGYDQTEFGRRRFGQEMDGARELVSRYHQITGKSLVGKDNGCAHCGERF